MSKKKKRQQQTKVPQKAHPLESSWTFWYIKRQPKQSKNSKGADWASWLFEVGTFDSIETFWQIHHHMPKATYLDDYYLFKTGIKPMWEDPANQNGGKWVFRFPTRDRQHLTEYWQNVVLALIGETVDDGDTICGAALSKRPRADRIAIWTRNTAVNTEAFGNRIQRVMLESAAHHNVQKQFDSHAYSITNAATPSKVGNDKEKQKEVNPKKPSRKAP